MRKGMTRTDFYTQLARSIRDARAAEQTARDERKAEIRALHARLDRLYAWEQLRPQSLER